MSAGVETTAMKPAPERLIGLSWLQAQAISSTRHVQGLRPFRTDEFGSGAEAPSEAHIAGANRIIALLRANLDRRNRSLVTWVRRSSTMSSPEILQTMLVMKERAHQVVRAVEKVWDFYFELFGQRQSKPYGGWLLSCDRIALDCYQACYLGIGTAKSIPAPPPFSYMRTGFSPATYRRGVPLTKLGKQINPFPLVQLPYHRLINPWTLGAILHEVSHNLQSDLGMDQAVPRAMATRLLRVGVPADVATIWTRWNREIYADLSGLLLGGPAIVGSLLDIIGRSAQSTLRFSPHGVHPTPYLRAFLSIELLRRMGFTHHARRYEQLWTRMYPNPRQGTIPHAMLQTFPAASRAVVDTICFQPFRSLGNRRLSEVIRFGEKEAAMIEEAAGRLASGNDPGVIPARFLIGASRRALDRRLAPPAAITAAFYKELERR